jgi:hypothetical protein
MSTKRPIANGAATIVESRGSSRVRIRSPLGLLSALAILLALPRLAALREHEETAREGFVMRPYQSSLAANVGVMGIEHGLSGAGERTHTA